MNKYRKHYKSFIEYTRTMLAMDERVTMDTMEALGFKSRSLVNNPTYWGSRDDPEDRAMYTKHLDKVTATNDLDLMYSLAQFSASVFGGYNYKTKSNECLPKHFDLGFAEFLKYQFADNVFEAEPVPLGKGFFNRNQKYVSSK